MICQFEKIIYPPDIGKVDLDSYIIALYRPCEKIKDTAGNAITQVKAVGYCLPVAKKLRYDMQGHWSKNPKHGLQFEVESYKEVIMPTKEGVIAYLSSGQIKGIGPKIAERIYDSFGIRTLEVLDQEPKKLLEISGISQGKLEKIYDSYLANRGARDVVAFLAPHGITPNRAVRLYQEYGEKTMDIVKNHPYQLCEIAGIGFPSADKIAMSMGFQMLSPERVDEGILYTLADAEGKGHLCMQKQEFLKACLKVLNTPQLTEPMVANRATRLIYSGRMVMYRDFVYRVKTAAAEESLARAISYQMKHQKTRTYGDLETELDQEELQLGIRLAPEQREAVKMALTHGLSIITGGPGTGKTMIQKALLDIYRRKHFRDKIVCCAPTGRAARRLEQSTGYPASTVHKALGLTTDEEEGCNSSEMMEADLILVDEVSMLDIFLAGYLFDSVKAGSRMVLIGDADQLASVGPGAVLSEMIASGCIPVVRLDKVYRQDDGSRIAVNAKRIRHGSHALEYGADFQLIESANLEQSAKIIEKLYLQEIAQYGMDHVALLTPYRQKTETGVNALNMRLRERVNPLPPGGNEMTSGKRTFRSGDKVMQIKNNYNAPWCTQDGHESGEGIFNGDTGVITSINSDAETVTVNFDGHIVEYTFDMLDELELAYAMTVHKSQGSEYQSVIINLQSAHSIMLTRALLYTAITRGKVKVSIVGERRALCIAVRRADTEKRGTLLSYRIQEFIK